MRKEKQKGKNGGWEKIKMKDDNGERKHHINFGALLKYILW